MEPPDADGRVNDEVFELEGPGIARLALNIEGSSIETVRPCVMILLLSVMGVRGLSREGIACAKSFPRFKGGNCRPEEGPNPSC